MRYGSRTRPKRVHISEVLPASRLLQHRWLPAQPSPGHTPTQNSAAWLSQRRAVPFVCVLGGCVPTYEGPLCQQNGCQEVGVWSKRSQGAQQFRKNFPKIKERKSKWTGVEPKCSFLVAFGYPFDPSVLGLRHQNPPQNGTAGGFLFALKRAAVIQNFSKSRTTHW